jgi:hypothetical protein
VLAHELTPALINATLGSGTYMNEGNFMLPGWQDHYYGENYPQLLQVKRKYDPDSLFYTTTAVGSEDWEIDSEGRLCRNTHAS